MPRPKSPGRDYFAAELAKIDAQIPYYYSDKVKELLKKPDMDSVYIQNVRKGHTVDLAVLEALKKLAKKKEDQQLVNA